jgi:hypothetical protein
MAEVKDKVVTVESLAAVHTHGQNTYMTKNNPSGTGTFSMSGDGDFTGDVTASSITIGNAVLNYDSTVGALKVSFVTE